jgi:H+/gluconate symporter-like permease
VHWFSISNSFMIVLFLSVMIAVILLRALRKVSCAVRAFRAATCVVLVHGFVPSKDCVLRCFRKS